LSDFFKMSSRGSGGGGSSGGGGGGGGFGNMSDPDKQRLASMVGLGVMGLLGLYFMNQMRYR
jgi:hypothetical protein